MPDDRYPPHPLNDAAQMAEEIRDLKRRLSALEGARNLRDAKIGAGGRMRFAAGGQILLENDNGDAATVIGEIFGPGDTNTAYGLLIQERFSGDYDGLDVLTVTDHGWGIPEWTIPLVGPHMSYSTSSTSYDNGWRQAVRVVGRELYMSMRLVPPGGQTISYRIQMSLDDGSTFLDVYELTGVSSNTNDNRTHTLPSGVDVGDWVTLFIDIKVSGGTGSAYPRFGPYWQVRPATYEGTPS